ncbi:MAG TPA: ABC transporter permease [Candidatus Angelobacter sp.]|nr:ABC transporter permease [Candidatus Angelobacter sp.]
MPDWDAKIREQLAPLGLDPSREAEIVEELAQHLDDSYRTLLREGLTPEEARQAALLELERKAPGDLRFPSTGLAALSFPPTSPSQGWALGAGRVVIDLWRDLRFAVRSLKKQPGFTVLAVLTLSLGIGATTVGFGVVENLLFEAYPYKGANRMVLFAFHNLKAPRNERRVGRLSIADFLEYQKNNHVFDGMVGWYSGWIVYTGQGGSEDFRGAYVTPNTFEFLGVPALLGRGITLDDGKPGAPPVFVMNYRLWQERFGGDTAILGKVFTLDDQPKTLVGIMPPRFQMYGARIWLPLTLTSSGAMSAGNRITGWLFVLGRLKPKVSMRSAAADLDVIARQLSKVYVEDYPAEFAVVMGQLNDAVLGNFKATLYALMAAVSMLLLIACSNVANLLLARATMRDREMAIRSSIGASPGRLVRQLLVESFVLAGAGLAGGCFLAYWGLKAVVATIPPDPIPESAVIGLNPAVLWLSVGVALVTTLLCGLAPALHALRGDLPGRLAASGRSSADASGKRKLRAGLVVAEVAISLVLLTGAGLMVRTLLSLTRVSLGLDPSTILFAQLSTRNVNYDKVEQQKAFFRQLLERVRAMPAVNSVAVSSSAPLITTDGSSEIQIPGKEHEQKWESHLEFCSEDYFRTVGLKMIRGRALQVSDIDSARQVAVVNQALAKLYFGDDDPVGRRIRFTLLNHEARRITDFEIVGVVSDFKNQGVRNATEPQTFLPYTISTIGTRFVLVNTALDPPEDLRPALRRAIGAVDPGMPMGISGSIGDWLRATSYKAPRFGVVVLGAFAGIGLALAIVGIFSLMAYTVSLQTHEVGIRMALGAERGDILRMVVSNGLRLIVAGVVAGLFLSLILTRFLSSQLWGVSANDSWTYIAVVTISVAAGVAACILPARRATEVDPLIAIRCE